MSAVVRDWRIEAAEEIIGLEASRLSNSLESEDVMAIIAKHCPFKPDCAYIEVGSELPQRRLDKADVHGFPIDGD